MPLKEAVDCTTAAITEISRRQSLLLRWIKTTGLASRDDFRLAVGQSLAMAQDAVNRLQRLIRRFEGELPDFPRSELESMLATCEVQRASLIDVAVRAGLIQTR
jgi:isopropylmalate/homocitrate/citramalate synthase